MSVVKVDLSIFSDLAYADQFKGEYRIIKTHDALVIEWYVMTKDQILFDWINVESIFIGEGDEETAKVHPTTMKTVELVRKKMRRDRTGWNG